MKFIRSIIPTCIALSFIGLTLTIPPLQASPMQLAASSSSNSVLDETKELNKDLPKMVDDAREGRR